MSQCPVTHLVTGAQTDRVVMADGRGGGQGAYTPLLNVIALALAVAIGAPTMPVEPRFDIDAGLLAPMLRITNTSSALHPSLPN